MGVFSFFLYVLLQLAISFIFQNKKKESLNYVSVLSLFLAVNFLIFYLSVLLGIKLIYPYVLILLLQFYYCIKNGGSLLGYRPSLSHVLFALFLLVSSVFILNSDYISWNSVPHTSYALGLWKIHGLKTLSYGLKSVPSLATEGPWFLFQTFTWAAVNSVSTVFSYQLGVLILWLLFSFVLFTLIRDKKLYFLSIVIIFLFMESEYFVTAENDGLVAVYMAFLFYVSYNFLFKDNSSPLNLIGPAVILSFSRPDGFVMTLIVLVSFWIVFILDKLIFKKETRYKTLFTLSLIVGITVLLRVVFVLLFQYKFDLGNWLNTNSPNLFSLPGWWADIFPIMKRKFIENSYLYYPALLSLFLPLVGFSREGFLKYSAFISVVSGRFIFLVYVYLFVLPEGSKAMYFERYILNLYLLLWLLLFNTFSFDFGKLRDRVFELLLFSLCIFYTLKDTFIPLAFEKRVVPNIKAMCKLGDDKRRTIQLIDQWGTGYNKAITSIYAFPHRLKAGFSFGEKKNDSDIWTKQNIKDSGKFLAYTAKYIFILNDNEFFRTKLWPKDKPYPSSIPACVHKDELLKKD